MKHLRWWGWPLLVAGGAAVIWGYVWAPRAQPTEIFSRSGVAILVGVALIIAGGITLLVHITRIENPSRDQRWTDPTADPPWPPRHLHPDDPLD